MFRQPIPTFPSQPKSSPLQNIENTPQCLTLDIPINPYPSTIAKPDLDHTCQPVRYAPTKLKIRVVRSGWQLPHLLK
jgi:hypothetical protein